MAPDVWLVSTGALASTAVLSLVLTPTALWLALRRGVLDRPGGHKGHDSPVPYLGGLAIVVAFAVVVLIAAVVSPFRGALDELGVLLGCAVALSVMGLVDDLRGVPRVLRLIAEMVAAVALHYSGTQVLLFDAEWANLLLTVVWVVGVTNAFNLLDNMDGLSAGVATVSALSFMVVAATGGQFLVAGLAAAIAGCAMGFLRHNFHPARIYMGDAGSLFLGFVLAAIGVKLRFPGPVQVTFLVPILILGVAILDTTLVTVTRLLHGRSPFLGGRDHLSHRLVFVGLPVRGAVGLIYGAAVAHGYLGAVVSRLDVTSGYLIAAFVLAVDLCAGVLLARVPVYETSRRRHLMIREVQPHERESVTISL